MHKVIRVIFVIYLFLSGYTMAHHELWSDEIHSWNIAKGSDHFPDLIANTSYEGHPPGWYVLLWVLSKITHQVVALKLLQWVIACLVVYLVLFHSPFPPLIKMLIPFGYYFCYEYAVLSRNYAIGVLLTFCVCLVIRKDKKALYYTLLFLLSNIHLLTLLIAASLHGYFLLFTFEEKKRARTVLLHALAGALILLPSVYFICPPADSQLNTHFWMSRWDLHHLAALGEAPLQAFVPVPAWWNPHPWNTELLLEAAKGTYSFLRWGNPLLAVSLLGLACWGLRRKPKSLAFFVANLALSFLVTATVFPLTSARHAGFLFISFLVSVWLFNLEAPLTKNGRVFFMSLLVIQVTAGVFFVVQDIRLPFSNLYRMKEVLKEIPPEGKLVTDYWTMNAVVAFTDKPVYCIDVQKELSFVKWNQELTVVQANPHRLTAGIRHLFLTEKIQTVYFISQNPPATLHKIDPDLSSGLQWTLIDKREGALEGGSNLYLYRVAGLDNL
ncbi:MAG: hypothetical protein ABUL46_03565 [Chitinophaga rupis]